MSAEFHQLLNATIDHLQSLKTSGAQFVPLEGETLRALNGGVVKKSRVESRESRAETPAVITPAPPALDPRPSTLNSAKAQAMAELRERAMQCMKCAPLAAA